MDQLVAEGIAAAEMAVFADSTIVEARTLPFLHDRLRRQFGTIACQEIIRPAADLAADLDLLIFLILRYSLCRIFRINAVDIDPIAFAAKDLLNGTDFIAPAANGQR